MYANLASIMPQVVAVWCRQEGHDVSLVCYTGSEDLTAELPPGLDLACPAKVPSMQLLDLIGTPLGNVSGQYTEGLLVISRLLRGRWRGDNQMAYQFSGFFASPPVLRPDVMPAGAVWREVVSPFIGVGVRLSALIGKTPERADVEALARQLGVDAADRWLYLTYDCWGGKIDFVYGFGSRGGLPFGPVKENGLDAVKATYMSLMAHFGVSPEDALRFKPFERGYWGEV
jgi:hypothetical protein